MDQITCSSASPRVEDADHSLGTVCVGDSNKVPSLTSTVMSCGGRRVGTPFALQGFLEWLSEYQEDNADLAEGWIWGMALVSSPVLLMFIHHRLFYVGCKMGYLMKTDLLCALHSKLLKLSSSSISKVTTGHIINLASNDLKRFDMAGAFSTYLFFGPVEGFAVLVSLSIHIGFIPAAVGMAFVLSAIPIQSYLSKYMARLRKKVALATDKRVNLTSEVISGILAVKMLGREKSLKKDIDDLRAEEHRLLAKKNLVRAFNFALPKITMSLAIAALFISVRIPKPGMESETVDIASIYVGEFQCVGCIFRLDSPLAAQINPRTLLQCRSGRRERGICHPQEMCPPLRAKGVLR